VRASAPPAALFLLSCGLFDVEALRAQAPSRAGLREGQLVKLNRRLGLD